MENPKNKRAFADDELPAAATALSLIAAAGTASVLDLLPVIRHKKDPECHKKYGKTDSNPH